MTVAADLDPLMFNDLVIVMTSCRRVSYKQNIVPSTAHLSPGQNASGQNVTRIKCPRTKCHAKKALLGQNATNE